MKKIYEHSFAKAWLKKLGNEIYINGKNFLDIDSEWVSRQFKIRPLKTELVLGKELLDDDEMEELAILPYEDLKKKFNHSIYRLTIDGKYLKPWYFRQQYVYVISEREAGKPNEVPPSTFRRRGFKIEWNKKQKCFRGVGEGFGDEHGKFENGNITPWIGYGKEIKPGHNINYLVKREDYHSITNDLFDVWRGKELSRDTKFPIKELPVMITEEGDLLCIPKTPRRGALPKILIVGKTGKGKTFCLNSLVGRIFYLFQERVGIINDSLNQLYDLMLPMNEKRFKIELDMIGNKPRGLPVINLYMSCPRVKIKYADEHVGYRLVISFRDFLRGWRYYTFGVGRWDLGKAERYMTNEVINAIYRKDNINGIKNALYEILPHAKDDKEGKGIRNMIFKWVSTFENILRDEFTSNMFQKEEMTASHWKANINGEELYGHPFIISYEAGLLPIINNHIAKSYPIAEKQMVDLIKKIIRWQMEREEKRKRIWIAVDELKDFLTKKNREIYEALDELFTQGRFNSIGFIGNIQEYTKLSPSMKANSSHLIIFELQTAEERKAIAKDYGLDAERLEEIAKLKTFQCLFTTKEKVVIYNKDGKRRVVESGIWKGRILPPITTHKAP